MILLNRKEMNENSTAGIVLLDLRNSCKDIDADPPNNLFRFTGLSGFGSNNFALESAESGRLVVSHLWLYVRWSHCRKHLMSFHKGHFLLWSFCLYKKKELLLIHTAIG